MKKTAVSPLALYPEHLRTQLSVGHFSGDFTAHTMFLDMSGFTAMTEKLMSAGIGGAELLNDILNRILEPLIAIVHDYGGNISTFAGDAFTAFFIDNTSSELVNLCHRILLHFATIEEFSVKIGLACGRVEWGVVCLQPQPVWYYRGEAIDECARSEHYCTPDQVVAHRSFLGTTSLSCPLTIVSAEHFRIDFPADMPEIKYSAGGKVQDCVVETVNPAAEDMERQLFYGLLQNMEFSGEFRLVSVCFISFEYSNPDELREFVQTAATSTQQYGGYFGLLDFGDKGAVILLIFGAPQAHEKYCKRALSALLQIRTRALVPWKAGITSGRVFAGVMGAVGRCTYTVLGNQVNLAARLMGKADWNSILCDENTVRQEEDFFDFQFHEHLELKGLKSLTPSWQLLGHIICHNDKSAVLLGREHEAHSLKEQLNRALQANHSIRIRVSGVAGIGKSSLVQSVFAGYREGIYRLKIQGDALNQSSFAALEDWLWQVFGIHHSHTLECNRQEFISHLRTIGAALDSELERQELQTAALSLQVHLGLLTAAETLPGLSPEKIYQYARAFLMRIIRILSHNGPILIWVDDLQWLDAHSIELLALLYENFSCVLTMETLRLHEAENAHLPQLQFPCSVVMELGGLTLESTAAFIREFIGLEPVTELSRFVYERCQGNPFFVEQTLNYLREHQLLECNSAQVRLLSCELEVPDNISVLIISRVDRLESRLQNLLKTAAVCGREFSLSLLNTALNCQFQPEQIFSLIQDEFLRFLHELNYIFRHSLIQESIYQLLLLKKRRHLHRLIALAIEKQGAVEKFCFELARHFEAAGMRGRAIVYYRKAGKYFTNNFDHDNAIKCYDSLNRLGQNYRDRCAALLQKSKSLEVTGKWDLNQELLQQLMADRARLKSVELRAELYYLYGNFLMKRGFADWEIWFKKSFVLYCKEKQFAEAVQVISTHANRLYQQGKFKAALNLYRKGLVLPSPEREKELLRYRIETVRIDTGPPTDKFARKIELLKKRCQFCTAQRDIGELMVTLNGLGNEYFNSGKYKTAYRAYQKAMKLARKIGHRQWIAYTSAHIGSCYWVQGRFEEARTYYQLDLDIAKELGDRQAIGVASGMVGGIYMDLGYPEKYLEYLWVQLRISDELQIRFDQCFARQQIGYVYRLLGEYEKSLQWLDESIQIAREIKNSSQLCYSLYYKGLTLCQLRDFVKAWQCSSEASRLSQSIGNQDIFNLRMQLMVWVTAVKTGRLLPGVVEDYMLALLPEQRELKFRAEIYCELYFLTAEFRYQKSAEKLILRILKKQPGDSEYQELLARVRTLKTED